MIMAKIISTLPSKYNAFISAWDSVPDTNQTMDKLRERLLREETRMSADDDIPRAFAATTIDAKNNGRKQPGDKKKSLVCNYCKKPGHIARYCYAKKRANKSQKKENESSGDNSRTTAFVMSQPSDNFKNNSSELESFHTSDVKSIWFLDSGASRHLCCRRDWFSEFVPTRDDRVYMGNGAGLAVAGEGNVLVKRSVNREWLDGIIRDVLHVKFNENSQDRIEPNEACFPLNFEKQPAAPVNDFPEVPERDVEQPPSDDESFVDARDDHMPENFAENLVPDAELPAAIDDRAHHNLRPREGLRPPVRYEAHVSIYDEPRNYKEALSGSDAELWGRAIDEELEALTKNNTWTVVDAPSDRKTIGHSRQHQPGARDRRIDSTAAAPAAAAQQPQHSSSSAASAPSAQQHRHSSSRATTAQTLASIEISSAETGLLKARYGCVWTRRVRTQSIEFRLRTASMTRCEARVHRRVNECFFVRGPGTRKERERHSVEADVEVRVARPKNHRCCCRDEAAVHRELDERRSSSTLLHGDGGVGIMHFMRVWVGGAWSAPRICRIAAFRSCSICHRCLATATTAMSSAKPTIRTSPSKLRRRIASYITFHRVGPETDPCGTPAVTS
ncbi:unnamed protein product [Trichogramma brassicae]|uniref:Retrovirus-related Pol polyprotein from transposon TNT 1-94-like beta-barrel domain-containing protein n=1 Tax=Trichogramma brassicae TaxID=86971 RepID=A0A6H5I6W3_9HYME|nr:unnamed protein product [Trichogramma brassicae]